ncbi:MAG: hypothetical protein ACKVT0_05200 [Planctomycetaceae bacterium]
MRSVLVYEKSSNRVVEEIVSAVRKAWSDLTVVALSYEEQDDLDGRRLVVLPGYEMVLAIGVEALSRCAADWQATQACYVLQDPFTADNDSLHDDTMAASNDSTSHLKVWPYNERKSPILDSSSSRTSGRTRPKDGPFRQPRIQLDRFDPMTYHIASTPDIWNKLPVRSIRRLDQILPPPINTDFFTPGHQLRDEAYFCIYEECLAGTATIVEACRLAGHHVVVGTYASADMIPDAISEQSHVKVLEIHDPLVLREQYWSRRAMIVAQGGWLSCVLEAQACGMPVILTDRKEEQDDDELPVDHSLIIDMDSCGQGTGLFCDDHSCQSIFAAISELERRPQLFSPDLAWANAARFSPDCFGHVLKNLADQARYADLQSSSLTRQYWRKSG